MSKTPFQAFIELISLDQEIGELERKQEELQKDAVAIDQQITEVDQELGQYKTAWTQARKHVDVQELAMKELNEAESTYKKRLDMAQNQKEYKAITTELETVQKKQQEHEVTLLGAWNKVEQAEKAHKEHEQTHEQKRAELVAKLAEQEAAIKDFAAQTAQKEQERPEKTKAVAPEWLEKYAAMRSRVTNPVVPVQADSCTACFYSIPAQMMAELRRKKLLQCNQCYRFLYLEELHATPEGAEQSIPQEAEQPEAEGV